MLTVFVSSILNKIKGKLTYMNLGTRLKEARKAKGYTQADVAKAAGVSRVAISQWETGDTKQARPSNLMRACTFLGVDAEEMVFGTQKSQHGDSAKKNKSHDNVLPLTPSERMRAVPVISKIPAGDPREIIDAYPPGEGIAVEWSDRGSKYTFALQVTGDSMAPDFNEGDVIIVDPEVPAAPGRYVVARCKGINGTFKKYRARGMTDNGMQTFELVPLNPDYGTLQSDRDECEIIGVMIEHRKKY